MIIFAIIFFSALAGIILLILRRRLTAIAVSEGEMRNYLQRTSSLPAELASASKGPLRSFWHVIVLPFVYYSAARTAHYSRIATLRFERQLFHLMNRMRARHVRKEHENNLQEKNGSPYWGGMLRWKKKNGLSGKTEKPLQS